MIIPGLAVDIDDTLAETAKTCIQKTLERFGHPLHKSADELVTLYEQPGKVPEWDTPQVQEYIASLLKDPDFLFTVPTVDGSQQNVIKIHEKVPISLYITSRFQEAQERTIAWLEKHSFPAAPVILRDTETIHPQWKIQYLLEHVPECDGLIDDTSSAFQVSDHQATFPLYWFNRYHHAQHENQFVHSFSTWEELASHLLGKKS